MTATITIKADLTSKKPFVPSSGPITGLLTGMDTNKDRHPKVLTVETVRGTLRAKVVKGLRPALRAELSVGMAVRLWLRVKGDKVQAELVIPLQAKQAIEAPPCGASREACIWVCTSKSCCRRGGSQLLEKLQQAVEEQDQARIQIKKCGCLGSCKKGPSLKIRGDKKIHQVTPCAVPELLERVLSTN